LWGALASDWVTPPTFFPPAVSEPPFLFVGQGVLVKDRGRSVRLLFLGKFVPPFPLAFPGVQTVWAQRFFHEGIVCRHLSCFLPDLPSFRRLIGRFLKRLFWSLSSFLISALFLFEGGSSFIGGLHERDPFRRGITLAQRLFSHFGPGTKSPFLTGRVVAARAVAWVAGDVVPLLSNACSRGLFKLFFPLLSRRVSSRSRL